MKSKKTALLLFDLAEAIDEPRRSQYEFKGDNWEVERHVNESLISLGYQVRHLGLFDNLNLLIDEIKVNRPDIVFNLCESFKDIRNFEANIAGVLELLGVKYTGSHPRALRLCQDKALSKKILNYHKIKAPIFKVNRLSKPLKKIPSRVPYPVIVKPLDLEGSEGISMDSFCQDEKTALNRCSYIHKKHNTDAIIEEFVEGREFYVGIIGSLRPVCLPIRELVFKNKSSDDPKIATYRAKWDNDYRKKWGVSTQFANLNEELTQKIYKLCRKIFSILRLKSYIRIDLKLTKNNEIIVLEINPNPSLAKSDDFSKAALKLDYKNYEQLIEHIIELS